MGVRGDLPRGGRWASGDAAGLCCISWLELVVPGGITAPDKRSLPLISVKPDLAVVPTVWTLTWQLHFACSSCAWLPPVVSSSLAVWQAASVVPRRQMHKTKNSTGKKNVEAE